MISTKGRYAVRVLIDMAEHADEGRIRLKDIAERQEISEKYLQHIAKLLVERNLLRGFGGKGGGYELTRAPEDYPIIEILEATEGSLAPVACLAEGAEPCERAATCTTLPMWTRFNETMHEFFGDVTVADLLNGAELPI